MNIDPAVHVTINLNFSLQPWNLQDDGSNPGDLVGQKEKWQKKKGCESTCGEALAINIRDQLSCCINNENERLESRIITSMYVGDICRDSVKSVGHEAAIRDESAWSESNLYIFVARPLGSSSILLIRT